MVDKHRKNGKRFRTSRFLQAFPTLLQSGDQESIRLFNMGNRGLHSLALLAQELQQVGQLLASQSLFQAVGHHRDGGWDELFDV